MRHGGRILALLLPALLTAGCEGEKTWANPPDVAAEEYVAGPDEVPILNVSPAQCDFRGASIANPVTCTILIQNFGYDILVLHSVALQSPSDDYTLQDVPPPETLVYALEDVVQVSVLGAPAGVPMPDALVIKSSDPATPVMKVTFVVQ